VGPSASPPTAAGDQTPGAATSADPRASPLGTTSARPDPSLSPDQHQARIATGLARARAVLGRQNWANSRLAGERYYDRLPDQLKEKYPDGVLFTYEGFPIFDEYAEQTVILQTGFAGRRDIDEAKANRLCGYLDTPPGKTWHHKEDGKTLILVDRELHDAVRHWGGVVITKALNRPKGTTEQ
jgi:A nuclease of the HNH/ENDO VII superfamily with conserved WHH